MKKMLRILQALLLSLFLTAGAFVPVTADGGGNKAQVLLSLADLPGSFPGEKRTVDVDMKNQFRHGEAPFFFYIISNPLMFVKLSRT